MRKPIALFLTDTHLTKENNKLVENIFEQAVEICYKKGIRRLISGGDSFTNRQGLTLNTLLSFRKTLNYLNSKGITLDAISGNHDKQDLDDDNSYIDIFDTFDNFVVHRNSGGSIIGNVYFHFIPFFKKEKYTQILQESASRVDKKFFNILITHAAINGVRNNDGSEVTDSLDVKAYSAFDKVLVGHYHNSCKLGSNIFYTGSAYQGNYGENVADKGFHLIYDDGSHEFIPSKFPKYLKVIIDASDVTDAVNNFEIHKGSEDFVRFVFKGKQTDIDKINMSQFLAAGIDCKSESTEVNEAIISAENDDFVEFDKSSIIENLVEYGTTNQFEDDKLEFGLELLSKI